MQGKTRKTLAALAVGALAAFGLLFAAPAAAAPPTVTVVGTANITATTATLRCDVNNGGLATDVWATYKQSSDVWANSVATPKEVVNSPRIVGIDITGLSANTSYDWRCKADNADVATPVVTPTATFTTDAGGGGGGDIVIAAAGDVCDPNPTQEGGIGCRGTGNQIRNANPDAVVALGDLMYDDFDPNTVYDNEWGSFKGKTIPVLGNHDYKNGSLPAWNSYWGAAAHSGTDYQWREDLGSWSVIVANARGALSAINGRAPAVQALVNAANADGDNIVMAWHEPRWSSPCNGCHNSYTKVKPFYDIAFNSGVDLVLAAHDHRWEKFAPMSGSGVNASGVRQFMIGSGGAHADGGDGTPIAGSQLIKGNFVGVTFFTLGATSYSWDAQEVTNVNGTATTFNSGTESVR